MIIREMILEDVDQVAQIEAETFSMPWSADSFMEMIQYNHTYYLVAEENGDIIGCCGVIEVVGEGDISNVVVKESHRNQGICTKLLQQMIDNEREKGITQFTLEVRVSNVEAIHVYEKFGFKIEGIRKGFYEKPVEDGYIMWKRE